MNDDRKHAELVATGLGWPEGPTVLPDGSVVFVESYRSQLTVVGADGKAQPLRLYRRRAELLRRSAPTARSMSARTAARSGRGAPPR